MQTFIIEHPTRGTLKFFVSANEYGFSTSGSRDDPSKTAQFYGEKTARRIYDLLPDKIRAKCRILTWVEVKGDPYKSGYFEVWPEGGVRH